MKSIFVCALLAATSAISNRQRRGNSFPGPILPNRTPLDFNAQKANSAVDPWFDHRYGKEPWTPPLSVVTLQLEAQEGESVRHRLQHQLRAYLDQDDSDMPSDIQFVNLGDDDDTVEGARLKAAQMQAQLDQAVADADAKRAAQQKAFEQ